MFEKIDEHLFSVGDFRNEDHVGPAAESAVQGDPSGVTSHHFDHHDTFVAACRGVQAVERIDHHFDGGVKAEGHVRGGQIIVDRLGHADHRHARFLQLQGGAERSVPADTDQGAEPESLEGFARFGQDGFRDLRFFARADFGCKASAIDRSEDRSAHRHDAVHPVRIELAVAHRREEPLVAVGKPVSIPSLLVGGADHAADYRVEPRTIPAAGQHPDPLDFCALHVSAKEQLWCQKSRRFRRLGHVRRFRLFLPQLQRVDEHLPRLRGHLFRHGDGCRFAVGEGISFCLNPACALRA